MWRRSAESLKTDIEEQNINIIQWTNRTNGHTSMPLYKLRSQSKMCHLWTAACIQQQPMLIYYRTLLIHNNTIHYNTLLRGVNLQHKLFPRKIAVALTALRSRFLWGDHYFYTIKLVSRQTSWAWSDVSRSYTQESRVLYLPAMSYLMLSYDAGEDDILLTWKR